MTDTRPCELLFRSDGRYQLDTRSVDPDGYAMTARGRQGVEDNVLTLGNG